MEEHRGRQRAYAGGLAFSYSLGEGLLTQPPLGGRETLPNKTLRNSISR
jgi:hypothetical protein